MKIDLSLQIEEPDRAAEIAIQEAAKLVAGWCCAHPALASDETVKKALRAAAHLTGVFARSLVAHGSPLAEQDRVSVTACELWALGVVAGYLSREGPDFPFEPETPIH